MDEVITLFTDHLSGKTDITAEDIAYLVGLYDQIMFDDEIEQELQNKNLKIKFTIGNHSDIQIENGVCNFITIAPKNIPVLLFVTQHNIIHLAIMLFNGHKPTHDKIFKCMAEELFGHTQFGHDLMPVGYFVNRMNSCYIDSLLMILFGNVSSFWRKNILDIDTSKYDYDVSLYKTCGVEDFNNYAQAVQRQLLNDYTSVFRDGHVDTCSRLRVFLGQCNKTIASNEIYSAYIVYDLLSDIFPDLKISFTQRVNNKISKQSRGMFTFWDFMEDDSESPVRIEWNKIDSPILVFHNEMNPPIHYFNKIGVEKGIIHLDGAEYPYEKEKVRAFGEKILNDRYSLVGIVMLEGIEAGRESGSHYTAYYKNSNKKWVYFNDVGMLREEDELPDSIWEMTYRMPNMFFYQKETNYKIIRRIGEGGQGVIYLVEKDGVKYILKKYFNEKTFRDEEHLMKFLKECHPLLVCYIESIPSKNEIIMEYIKGTDLSVLALNLSIPHERSLLKYIAEGIAFLHRHGIAHRDLKLENIMFDQDTQKIKIIDFGFACEQIQYCLSNNKQFGTPIMNGPEMFISGTKTMEDYIRNDIYSFGMMMYEILWGDLFAASLWTTSQMKQWKTNRNLSIIPQKVDRLRKRINIPQLTDIADKCLNMNPHLRPTMDEVIEMIKK
jgi:predicted Ser/Thr protein kinase